MGGPPEDIILSCYKLARYFHVDPDVFLAKPISELGRHMRWTNRLEQEIAAEQEAMQRMRD